MAAHRVMQVHRYPVKSMRGEELNEGLVTARGVLGGRGYALIDQEDGRVVSAKNPRKWPGILNYAARYPRPPRVDDELPPVEITLPDGTTVRSDDATADAALSCALGRPVEIRRAAPPMTFLEELWREIEGMTPVDEMIVCGPGDTGSAVPIAIAAPPGTFFDYAAIHLITTATLDRLRALYPTGRFDVRRFRPNLVVSTDPSASGFVENEWIGRAVKIGKDVRLEIIESSSRCVVTTLPQGDLEADPEILRTIARHHPAPGAKVAPGQFLPPGAGVYARVTRDGIVRRGDVVRVE